MRAIFSFVGHTISAMVKGFFLTGIAAAIISFGVLLFASHGHHLVMGIDTAFAITISVLAALLGSAVALVYRLSHIGDARHVIQSYTESRASQRQQGGK
jgi:hypothetical protein